MTYTITLTNTYKPDTVIVSDPTISPSPEYIPDTNVMEYISDSSRSDNGFVSIPLYNRLQYVNIPPNSVLTLYTENSDEAAYYTNMDIEGCNIEIGEQSSGGGLPEVTDADNGKVLTVVDGEWNKADASGG